MGEPCRCPLCASGRWSAATLLALSACAAGPPDPPEELRRFIVRPVEVVASDAFPDECIEAIVGATDYFRTRRVNLSLTVAHMETTPVFYGSPRAGVIAIYPDRLPMSPYRVVHGETRHALSAGGHIVAAEVTLEGCDEHATTHELGHALGLVHVWVAENLMHGELPLGGWDLDDQQLAWIAD